MVDFPNEFGLIRSREIPHAGLLGESDHVTEPPTMITGCSEYRLPLGGFLSTQVAVEPLTTGASTPVQTATVAPAGSWRVTRYETTAVLSVVTVAHVKRAFGPIWVTWTTGATAGENTAPVKVCALDEVVDSQAPARPGPARTHATTSAIQTDRDGRPMVGISSR